MPRHTEGFASLLAVDVVDHPLHNHRNHRLPPLGAPEELQLIPIIHEPAFHQCCRTFRSIQDIEPCFFVRVAIGIVRPDLPTSKITFSCMIQAGRKLIAPGLSRRSVAAPAGGIVPLSIGACSVDMDGDQHDIVFAQLVTQPIHSLHPLLQRDVFEFRHQEFGVEVAVL